MAEVSREIRDKVEAFYSIVKGKYPIERVFLFGSWAKGKAEKDSDIDVGVVVDMPNHQKRIEINAGLLHYANMIDTAIEPKCVFSDEYYNRAGASILNDIIHSSIEIARADIAEK